VFGSFWDGLKMVKLSPDGMSVAEDINQIPTVASRKLNPEDPNPPAIDDNPVDAGGNAIEAPFIFKRMVFTIYSLRSIIAARAPKVLTK
jgi:arabinan endo-1,5-alpha-L-arabinosidase